MAKKYNSENVRVARKNASTGKLLEKGFISESDKEMDDRANEAVKAAIRKHRATKKPIAYYEQDVNEVFLEYPGGERVNVRN